MSLIVQAIETSLLVLSVPIFDASIFIGLGYPIDAHKPPFTFAPLPQQFLTRSAS
jgi:hypothetical protein